MDYSVVVTGLVCFGLGLFLFVRRNTGCRVWASPLSLVVTLVLVVLMPAASFAASTDPGQAAAPGPTAQDCLTVIVWTIAALSIAEMIRNSIQGLFTRLSGINESGFATKAVGAISGVGALFGLANLSRTTVGGFSGHSGGFSGGQRTGEINLAGVNSPLEGASLQTDGVFAGKPYGEMAGSNFSLETPGTTVGLQRASQTGNRWGSLWARLPRERQQLS